MSNTPKDIYQASDIAHLMGLNQDTLRYYEKSGLISPPQISNGFRYYTRQDISRLVAITYQRKMNIPLNDMKLLWSETNTIAQLAAVMDVRLQEEEHAIREHRQTIARLRLMQQNCRKAEHNIGEISEIPFPSSYVVVPHTTMEEGSTEWFSYGKEYPGLDMLYQFDEYESHFCNSALQIEYKNTQLVLYQWLAEYVDYPLADHQLHPLQTRPCLYQLCTSAARTPSVRTIKEMHRYADSRGIKLTGEFFSMYSLYGMYEGRQHFYLELYFLIQP